MIENEKEAAFDDAESDGDEPDDGDGLGELRAAITERERRYVEFLITGKRANHTEAARRAGYKDTPHLPRQAYRLRNKPAVRAYLEALLDAHGASRGEILRNLSAIARMNWREPLTLTLDSGQVVQVRPDIRSIVEACRLLAIYRGMIPTKGSERQGVAARVIVRSAG